MFWAFPLVEAARAIPACRQAGAHTAQALVTRPVSTTIANAAPATLKNARHCDEHARCHAEVLEA